MLGCGVVTIKWLMIRTNCVHLVDYMAQDQIQNSLDHGDLLVIVQE